MDIGGKLRQARLEAGLSQRQLCGDMITRNMLSLIENGSARPSMDTLVYLAGKLNRPISYFLEDGATSAPNAGCMEKAREAYLNQKYPEAAAILQEYQPDGVQDAEFGLLKKLVLLAMAEEALDRPLYARELLGQAAEAETCYQIPELEQRRLLLLAQAGAEDVVLPGNDRWLLCRAKAALNKGDTQRCIALLEACEEQTGRQWRFLRGEAAFACEAYAQAAEYYPEDCYARLEECWRNLGDYKKAYEMLSKQR